MNKLKAMSKSTFIWSTFQREISLHIAIIIILTEVIDIIRQHVNTIAPILKYCIST